MYQLYILELKDNNYYIGITQNIESRLIQHSTGCGAKWTRKHTPEQIIYLKPISTNSRESKIAERVLTLKCIKKYGIDRVRGGAWCQRELPDCSRNSITYKINNNICFKCYNKGHHADECTFPPYFSRISQ
jgi:predicted GIY-YIG superfamily endonuclease